MNDLRTEAEKKKCVRVLLNVALGNCSENHIVIRVHIKDYQKILLFMKDMK